jgi:hypothetical protein
VSIILHATVYVFLHYLLNVLAQIANKMGLQKKAYQINYKDELLLYKTNIRFLRLEVVSLWIGKHILNYCSTN